MSSGDFYKLSRTDALSVIESIEELLIEKHKITPKTIEKSIQSIVDHELKPEVTQEFIKIENLEDLPQVLKQKQVEMKTAAQNLEFEKAAILRDEIIQGTVLLPLREVYSGHSEG